MLSNYKGFKIQESKDGTFKIYTKEEWAYGKGFRSCEWEACTMKEAHDFIDSYEEGSPVTDNNYLGYELNMGFRLMGVLRRNEINEKL